MATSQQPPMKSLLQNRMHAISVFLTMQNHTHNHNIYVVRCWSASFNLGLSCHTLLHSEDSSKLCFNQVGMCPTLSLIVMYDTKFIPTHKHKLVFMSVLTFWIAEEYQQLATMKAKEDSSKMNVKIRAVNVMPIKI